MARVPNFRENIEETLGKTIKKMNMILASDPRIFQAMIEKFERDTGKQMGTKIQDYPSGRKECKKSSLFSRDKES